MRKIAALLLSVALLAANTVEVKAGDFVEPVLMRATVYTSTEGAITADGSRVREGIIAAKDCFMGYCVILYENNNGKIGDFIGFYEVKDTGGAAGIKKGTVLDVYRDNLTRCKEWVNTYGDYVFVQIIPAKG